MSYFHSANERGESRKRKRRLHLNCEWCKKIFLFRFSAIRLSNPISGWFYGENILLALFYSCTGFEVVFVDAMKLASLFSKIKKSNEKMSILLINETVDLIKFAHFISVKNIHQICIPLRVLSVVHKISQTKRSLRKLSRNEKKIR